MREACIGNYDIGKEWCPCLYTGALVFAPHNSFLLSGRENGQDFSCPFFIRPDTSDFLWLALIPFAGFRYMLV